MDIAERAAAGQNYILIPLCVRFEDLTALTMLSQSYGL
jgi:hypothetical protein